MQAKGWHNEKAVKRVFGMDKAARENSLSFDGWPTSHVLAILRGSGGGKLVTAMGHNSLCAPCALCSTPPSRSRTSVPRARQNPIHGARRCLYCVCTPLLVFTIMCACRSYYGALKGTEVASSDEAARFVHHLVTLEALKVVSERLEKKAGEKFTLSRQSLALGPTGLAVLEGKLPVRFAVQVCSCSTRSTAQLCTGSVHDRLVPLCSALYHSPGPGGSPIAGPPVTALRQFIEPQSAIVECVQAKHVATASASAGAAGAARAARTVERTALPKKSRASGSTARGSKKSRDPLSPNDLDRESDKEASDGEEGPSASGAGAAGMVSRGPQSLSSRAARAPHTLGLESVASGGAGSVMSECSVPHPGSSSCARARQPQLPLGQAAPRFAAVQAPIAVDNGARTLHTEAARAVLPRLQTQVPIAGFPRSSCAVRMCQCCAL